MCLITLAGWFSPSPTKNNFDVRSLIQIPTPLGVRVLFKISLLTEAVALERRNVCSSYGKVNGPEPGEITQQRAKQLTLGIWTYWAQFAEGELVLIYRTLTSGLLKVYFHLFGQCVTWYQQEWIGHCEPTRGKLARRRFCHTIMTWFRIQWE